MNPNETIYIGDTEGDRRAAEIAGIKFVYAKYGFGEVSRFDYEIKKVNELLSL